MKRIPLEELPVLQTLLEGAANPENHTVPINVLNGTESAVLVMPDLVEPRIIVLTTTSIDWLLEITGQLIEVYSYPVSSCPRSNLRQGCGIHALGENSSSRKLMNCGVRAFTLFTEGPGYYRREYGLLGGS